MKGLKNILKKLLLIAGAGIVGVVYALDNNPTIPTPFRFISIPQLKNYSYIYARIKHVKVQGVDGFKLLSGETYTKSSPVSYKYSKVCFYTKENKLIKCFKLQTLYKWGAREIYSLVGTDAKLEFNYNIGEIKYQTGISLPSDF